MALDQQVTVTYGSYRFGGAVSGRDAKILGRLAHVKEYGTATVRFRALVHAGSAAALITAETALLDAVTSRDLVLTVSTGASARWTYSPATNSGLDTVGFATKSTSSWDTNYSVVYDIEFLAKLPSEGTGEDGLGEVRVAFAYEPSRRRTCTISGVYTAVTSGVSGGPRDASAQYAAAIDAAATALLPSGDWELDGEGTTRSRTDKEIEFSRTFEEVIWGDSAGATNSLQVVGLQLRVGIADASEPSADSSAQPPAVLLAAFGLSVRFDQTTDLASVWASDVWPHLQAEIATRVGAGRLVFTRAAPAYEPRSNRITGTIEGLVYRTSLLALRVRTRDTILTGKVLSPRADGIPFSYDQDDGFPTWTRTIRQRIARRGGAGESSDADGHALGLGLGSAVSSGPSETVPTVTSIPNQEGFVRVLDDADVESVSQGLTGQVEVELRDEVAVFQRVAGADSDESSNALALGIL